VGRPKKEIDTETVYKLARLGCTNEEIGDWFGVSDETIRVRFLDDLKIARADQKISLRRRQWLLAQRSVPMAIHLGREYLGQGGGIDADSLRNMLAEALAAPHDPGGPGAVSE
jgi:hypothetical protein